MPNIADIESVLSGQETEVKTRVRELNSALTNACDLLEKIKRARRRIYELNRSTMPVTERYAAISRALAEVQKSAERAGSEVKA